MEVLGVATIALLALACPLGMVGMAVVPWLVARARGQKKELHMGCMPMGEHGEQQPSGQTGEGNLKEEVARLQGEVQALKAQLSANGTGAHEGATAVVRGKESAEPQPSRSATETT